MDNSHTKKQQLRKKRILRVRKKLRGDVEKPRLCIVKTNAHIHVQLIDDENGVTLASTSTISKEFKGTEFGRRNKTSGKQIGLKIAELAKAKSVKRVVLDRGASKYHGVIAAVADGAREGGLEL